LTIGASIDETLPNFIERKHERERKGNKGQGPKYMHTNNPTKVGHKEEKGTTKN
jgi:hypothetical protein